MKVKIETIIVGPLQTNCYIVTDEDGIGVVIDPGFEEWKISEIINKNEFKIDYIILTHGHYDHFSAAAKLKENTGAKIVIHKKDNDMLNNADLNLLCWFNILKDKNLCSDLTVDEGDLLTAGSLNFSFIHTPGHTKGSMCVIIEDCIFSGDTLFYRDAGRTDLPEGSHEDLINSFKKLKELKGDYKVYPGHLEPTNLNFEKQNNHYFR